MVEIGKILVPVLGIELIAHEPIRAIDRDQTPRRAGPGPPASDAVVGV
jgi:hypothetical protein